jgi:hypothetical protein
VIGSGCVGFEPDGAQVGSRGQANVGVQGGGQASSMSTLIATRQGRAGPCHRNLLGYRPSMDSGGYSQPSNWGTCVSSCSLVLPNHFCSRAAAVPSRYIWLTALLTASQPLRSPFLMPMPYRS